MSFDQELFCLPQGEPPLPPIDTLEQTLPFDKLEWENFEKLIARIVSQEFAITDTYLYGVRGQDQSGLDILANIKTTEKKACFQCKRVKTFNALDIKTAVNKFLKGKWAQQTQIFVLCITIPMNNTQQVDEIDNQKKILRQKGIDFIVWDATETGQLSLKLKSLPEIVDDFFGREWVKRFNGFEKAEALGERANGYEVNHLRDRLFKFYSTLFARHDPGLSTSNRNHAIDLRSRYIPSDISEHIERKKIYQFNLEAVQQDNRNTINDDQRDNEHSYNKQSIQEYESTLPVLEWLGNQENSIVVGEPGLGKSVLLRFLALSIIKPLENRYLFNDLFFHSCIPIWISFSGFTAAIEKCNSLNVEDFLKDWLHQYGFSDIYSLFSKAIKSGKLLILLDGLDEAANENLGRQAIDRVITFIESNSARIICTSRPKGFELLSLPDTWKVGELQYLNDEKILGLARNWFRLIEFQEVIDNEGIVFQLDARSQSFLATIQSNQKTHELSKTPLICQALIELFHHRHTLPEVRVKVYQQIIDLLLTRHPKARVHAGGGIVTDDSLFIRQHDIFNLLIKLAWRLQVAELHASTLSRKDCKKICEEYFSDDDEGLGESVTVAKQHAEKMVDLLIDHYAILVERSPNQLNFVHLSLQEYLSAEQIIRFDENRQLSWLKDNWIKSNWRETLLSWFGVLESLGRKDLVSSAISILAKQGEKGEWQRIQSVILQTELATSDLGVKIREAREIVQLAINEIKTTPYPEYRVNLSKSIARGALGSKVSLECIAIISKWSCAHSPYRRKGVLRELKQWEPSEDLFIALHDAIYDEDFDCAKEAAISFATVFADDERCIDILKNMATNSINPQLRAVSIFALNINNAWGEIALEVANYNSISNDIHVIRAVIYTKIQRKSHNDDDLNLLLDLLIGDKASLGIFYKQEMMELFCQGWPKHLMLKEKFLGFCRSERFYEHDFFLEYLVRQYPNSEEVAQILKKDLELNGIMILTSGRETLTYWLAENFSGNSILQNALVVALDKEKDKFHYFWHSYVNIFSLINNDKTKKFLIESYIKEKNCRDRYWIANTLLNGWSGDKSVNELLQEWINSEDEEIAAPLATWSRDFIEDNEKRRLWLLRMAKAITKTNYATPLFELLKEFPDIDTKTEVVKYLDYDRIWYYIRLSLKTKLISVYPNEIDFLKYIDEILMNDEASQESLVTSFESNPNIRSKLLKVVTSSATNVRMTFASMAHSRADNLNIVKQLLPEPLLEYNGSIRTKKLMAYAHAVRYSPSDIPHWKELFLSELDAVGPHYEQCRRSGLVGLLELEAYPEIINFFNSDKAKGLSSDNFYMLDYLNNDNLAISEFIKKIDELHHYFKLSDTNSYIDLKVGEFIKQGYESDLERTQLGKSLLKKYYNGLSENKTIQEVLGLAKQNGFTSQIKLMLLQKISLTPKYGLAWINEQNTIAKLLVENYSWEEVSENFGQYLGQPEGIICSLESGVLGWFAVGWLDSPFANWVRCQSQANIQAFTMTNKILASIVLEDNQLLEKTVLELANQNFVDWEHYSFLREALIKWAQSHIALPIILEWLKSSNYYLFSLALSLIKEVTDINIDYDQMVDSFNDLFKIEKKSVFDCSSVMDYQQSSLMTQLFPKITLAC